MQKEDKKKGKEVHKIPRFRNMQASGGSGGIEAQKLSNIQNSSVHKFNPLNTIFPKTNAVENHQKPQRTRNESLRRTTLDPEKIEFYKRVQLIAVLIINFIASLSLILSNKYLFKIWNIHPVKLVCFHLVCTTICNLISNFFGMFKFKKAKIIKILPLAICFCGFVVLTNLSLETNTVGTYQILKCLSDPALIVIQQVLYNKNYTWSIKLSLAPMVFGVVINSAYDLSFNTLGLIYGLSAVLFTAFYTVWVGRKQQDLELNSMQLLMYQAPLSTVLLMVSVLCANAAGIMRKTIETTSNLAIFDQNSSLNVSSDLSDSDLSVGNALDILLETPDRLHQPLMSSFLEPEKFVILCATGMAAYCVNLTTFWIIGNTSVVTYAVFAKVKLCATVLSGVIFFGDRMNSRQAFGVMITLSGVFWYTYVKVKLDKNKGQTGMIKRQNSGSLENKKFGKEGSFDKLTHNRQKMQHV